MRLWRIQELERRGIPSSHVSASPYPPLKSRTFWRQQRGQAEETLEAYHTVCSRDTYICIGKTSVQYSKACGDEADGDLRRSLLSCRWRKMARPDEYNISARACRSALSSRLLHIAAACATRVLKIAVVALARARFRGPSGVNTKSRVFKARNLFFWRNLFFGGVAVRSESQNRLFVAHHREATTTFTRSRRAVSRFGPRCSDD